MAALELHARRPSDVPHLRALDRELRALGIEPELSAGAALRSEPPAGFRSGPVPSHVRLLVEDPHDPAGPSAAEAERVVVLWTSAGPPQETLRSIPAALAQAALVLVPGPAHEAALRGRIAGAVEAVGLPALDAWSRTPRESVRAQLHVSAGTRLWLYAPSGGAGSPALWLREKVEALCEPGVLLAICAVGWPEAWRDGHRELAAHWPGMVLIDESDPVRLLCAGDAVIADATALLFAAFALGLRAVRLEEQGRDAVAGPPLAGSIDELRAALGRPESKPAADLLVRPGTAAARSARHIAELCGLPGPDARPGSRPGVPREPRLAVSWAEPIEAQIAFGDLDGALAALTGRVESDASPRAQRMIAVVHRMRCAFDQAEQAAAIAERAARDELAQALCERARVDVECERFEQARERFQQAAQIAPELADPAVGLGSLALHAGDGARAEAHFCTALRFEKTARVWSGLGLALCAQGRSRDALPALQAALDLDAECQAALYGLVQAALQTGELAAAQVRLHTYVERHPGNLGFAFSLAAIELERGQLADAERLVEQIELFDRNYPGLGELRAKLRAAA